MTINLSEVADKIDNFTSSFATRLDSLEKRAARERDGGGLPVRKTIGGIVANSPEVQKMNSSFRGEAVVRIAGDDYAAITSAPATVGSNTSTTTSLVAADRREEIIAPPEQRFVIRDLLPNTQTLSNSIEYPRETGYTNNAAPVAETTAKPYSDLTFDLTSAPVRTLAHLFKASRQILDDAPALAGYIDRRARYGIRYVEDRQILFGTGTGQNLLGIVPQATGYETSRTAAGDTELDILLHAIAQSEEAELPATGMVLSVRDWRRILGIKDGDDRYLSGGPFGTTAPRIWDLPVIPSMSMPVGQFLLGGFASGGAEVFDRMELEVLVSSENTDDWEKNMVTVRAEERLALAVYRPEAFVTGSLSAE